MKSNSLLNASDVISKLKKDLDAIWENYAGNLSLEHLVYLGGVHGMLQREELPTLLEQVCKAKEHADWLYESRMDLTVLVIDDSTEILDITKRFLHKNGIEADVASGGRLGVQMLSENPGKYTLVLLDVHMPDMDGYSVLEYIRENEDPIISSIPVIAVSGEVNATDCINFNYYLRKPVNFKEIIPAIYRVLDENMTKTEL